MSVAGQAPLWTGFMPVLRRVEISLVVRSVEPLRIGAGRGGGDQLGSPIDLPVYRQQVYWGDGRVTREPVIPGSSFKGVLRTATMVFAGKCGFTVHSGVGDDNCVKECFGSVSNFDKYRAKAVPDVMRRLLAGLCPLCLLYGGPSISGRVVVEDFTPLEPGVPVGIKTGVGIDRRRGASARGVLYTVEYVEPGTAFKGAIRAVNTPNWLLSLLAASILAVGQGWFKLGGFKSRGMGLVEIDRANVSIRIWQLGAHGTAGLAKLDEEVDEEHELNGCSVENSAIRCGGEAGYRVLESLARSWDELYCQKANRVWRERRQWLDQNVCQQYKEHGGFSLEESW